MPQTTSISYDLLPSHMIEGTRLYVEYGIEPGSFLRAVLENNLVGAAGHADAANRHALHTWATWLFNEAPAACWGSHTLVSTWISEGGLHGRHTLDS